MAAVATTAEISPTGKLFPLTVFLFIEKFKSSASGSGNTIQAGACSLNILLFLSRRKARGVLETHGEGTGGRAKA